MGLADISERIYLIQWATGLLIEKKKPSHVYD